MLQHQVHFMINLLMIMKTYCLYFWTKRLKVGFRLGNQESTRGHRVWKIQNYFCLFYYFMFASWPIQYFGFENGQHRFPSYWNRSKHVLFAVFSFFGVTWPSSTHFLPIEILDFHLYSRLGAAFHKTDFRKVQALKRLPHHIVSCFA